MKMKLTTLSILLLTGMVSVTSCNNNEANKTGETTDTTSKTSVTEEVKQGAENVANKVENAFKGNADSNFVVNASLDNNKELRLLQAGADNGTDKELKAHAKMMITDHKKLGAEVKEYASKKGYVLPEGDNGKADDELGTLQKKTKGKDWDKEWTDALVSGHRDAIALFESNQNNVKDAELKTMITNALPTLHKHMDMVKNLQDKMGK
jgi:putative membrane protein